MLTEIIEGDYRIAGSATGFVAPGEYGPLPCGCCLVSLAFDPVGPRLLLVMAREDATCASHTIDEFEEGAE